MILGKDAKMDGVNRTLYIPLYGKAYVNGEGLFLKDLKAEEIWSKERFPLKGKAKSKWLAYYMGIRAAVFDEWVRERLAEVENAAVVHLGCGMDSRVLRVEARGQGWYDVDFPEVIAERKRYYAETEGYRMIAGDLREEDWLSQIPKAECAIVVMEGVSMYLSLEEKRALLGRLHRHFGRIFLLMDCYTELAARLGKRRNPVHGVGVSTVWGMDDPKALNGEGVAFVKEHPMTPAKYVDELCGMEKRMFRGLYAGRLSQKLYRLFEYRKA